LGLAYRPRARYGERVSEAGSRRQSRGHGGGLSMILRGGASCPRRGESTRRGKASWYRRSGASLTRQQRRRCLAVSPGRFGRKAGAARAGPRQRASEATSQARLAVENAAVGRCSAEEHSIEAPPGPRGTTSPRRHDRGNPSGQGWQVAARLKLEVRRQAKLHLGAHPRPLAEGGSASVVGSGGPQGSRGAAGSVPGNRAVQRVLGSQSVAEVGETHLSRVRRKTEAG